MLLSFINADMEKDRRYALVKRLIDGGFMKSFRDIFEIIPKTRVATDLGMNNKRFSRLMHHTDEFVLVDIFRMARLFDVQEDSMLKMIIDQYRDDRRRKKGSDLGG